MATESGGESSDLKTMLIDESWRFSFFQAVRLLQLAAPERAPVGVGDDPVAEAVRFSSRVSLGFPSSEIHEVTEASGTTDAVGMVVNFMGLATPASYGSLPMPYTELLLEREREKNNALCDFIDQFNHRRFVSQLQRITPQHRAAISCYLIPGSIEFFQRAPRQHHAGTQACKLVGKTTP